MSRQSISLFEQARAITLAEDAMAELRWAIAAGPARIIPFLVNAIEDAIRRSGGTEETARLKREYAECHQLLHAREVSKRRAEMHAVPNCTTRGVS